MINEQNVTKDKIDHSPTLLPKEGDTVGKPKEFGGPKGPEPTRYGDWEQKGRCTDF